MLRNLLAAALVALSMFPAAAGGEALIFLQGYLGDGDGWRTANITDALRKDGWWDGGHLRNTPQGIRSSNANAQGSKRFYTLELATEAPLLVQLRQLTPYLASIRSRHAGESLVLVGHSAGGVLGRLYMVQYPDAGVDALITIASPHLGTESAELGLMAGQSPLAWFAPLLGAETLNRSQGLYFDLARERPSNLLYWLNRQEHPPARYVSVVRTGNGLPGSGDLLVPTWSQDMNYVYALRGRAYTVSARGGHGLTEADGPLLIRLLRRLQQS